jgi:uncharacterized protein GlcG (DUF336 family)
MFSLEDAKKAIEASEAKAKELGIAVTTVVVDHSGIIIALSRMDGAFPVSPKFAMAKAYTAGTLGIPTAGISEFSAPGKPYYGVDMLSGGELTSMGGGVPILRGKEILGGVGVGGSYDTKQDILCAEAAAQALQ